MKELYGLMTFALTLAVLVAYLNHRFIRMQPTIAIMLSSLLLSLSLIIVAHFGYTDLKQQLEILLTKIDFYQLLMNCMLSFLLFAGAINVNLHDLKERKWEVFTLASLGTVVSTVLIAAASYYLLNLLQIHLDFIYCLLFGALISPTDPIAVLAMCKEVKAPRKLEVCIAGESLFNDGVGIVLFLTCYEIAFAKTAVTLGGTSLLFLQETGGGIIYGLVLGYVGSWLIKSIDDSKLEILITLAVATGGYTLAQILHVSGPLAMVVAGILIGNYGRRVSMSLKTQNNLDNFWELLDEILNALLFFLIGFELLIIKISSAELLASALVIPLVLLARFIIVGVPLSLFKLKRQYEPHTIKILTWGGLRGGLAIALALALPASHYRNLILAMTYAVVIFSIAVQGTTVKSLIQLSKVNTKF